MSSDIDDGPEAASLTSLTDDLLTFVASFLGPSDLLNLPAVNRRFLSLDRSSFDAIWKRRCESRWEDWPRYRLSPACELYLDGAITGTSRIRRLDETPSPTRMWHGLPNTSWKRRFLLTEEEVSRTTLARQELEGLGWYFNFTQEAGGRGDETLARAVFTDELLRMDGSPPVPYRLVEVSPGQQQLLVLGRPPHSIHRLEEDKEWLICNEIYTFVSCGEEAELRFDRRGFRSNVTFVDLRDVDIDLHDFNIPFDMRAVHDFFNP